MLPFLVAATLVTAVAAVSDLRTGRIPNWLTLGSLCAGILGHLALGWHQEGWNAGLYRAAFSVGGVVFCSLAPGFLYWKGGMGGGDLKLFAALGALCHPLLGIEAQMYSLLAAALIAPARLAYEGKLFGVLAGSLSLLLNPLRRKERRRAPPREMMTWFRLGPAIFLGTATTLVANGYQAVAAASAS